MSNVDSKSLAGFRRPKRRISGPVMNIRLTVCGANRKICSGPEPQEQSEHA
jgi:hypothetical protein